MTRRRSACLGTLLLTLLTSGASAANPKRVLILDPFGHDVAPFSTAVSAFRATLARGLGEPMDVYELPLELARIEEPEGEAPLVALLGNQIKNHPVDLVVLVGGAGAQFAVRHRELLFPNTPILLIGADSRFVPPSFLRTNVTLIAQKVNLGGMVEDILQMQPQTTNIAVVFGASAFEKAWVNECRREFQSFTNRVGFTWLNDMSLDQIVKQCATLPPQSFVLEPLFVVDAAGVPSERDEALRRLHQAANAPIFAYPASELGQGSVGGRLFQDIELGERAALIAIRLLRGENPANIPHQALEAATPTYDWRELRRWGISEANLPVGSVIRFRQPSFWERYRWLVIGTALFCSLQAGLIVGLLVNRSKRKQGEAEARLIADISSKFVNLPPSEVDGEIINAERRICELLGLDVSSLWQWSPEAPEVLSLTHLYRLLEEPPAPEKMTAAEYFPWCQRELRAGRIIALSSLAGLPPEAARDRQTFDYFGIKSGLVLPLSAGGGSPVGALSFGTVRRERDWPDALVKRLQPVAEIFTNALARKRADQTLRESEERFRLLIEQAPEAVLVQDFDQDRLVDVNAQAEKLFGCSRQDLLAAGPQRFYTSEQPDGQPVPDSMRAHNERVLRGETVLFERTITNALGRRLDCEVRLVRLPAGGRKLIRGSFIDITERKQAEAALLRQRAELAHLSRVAMLGELSGSMAHELNQPLTAILSNAQAARRFLAGDQADLAEVRDILADIVAEDKRAGEIIHRLRLLLRKGEVQHQPLNVNEVVQEVLKLMRSDLVNHNVTAQIELAPDLPVVHGDRVQLQQVLLNLVMNACDAMAGAESSARQLTIRTDRSEDRSVRVSVSDRGPGIAPEKLEQIFESFYTTKPQGMGLGLAVCRTIITAHNGKLWATSKPGCGATLCFTLPATGR